MSTRFEKWQEKIDNCKGTRQSFAIQLDWSNLDDVELIKIIALLKDNHQFSEAMRQALVIIPALMAGSLDELFAEFPWVQAEFLQYVESLQINAGQGEKKTLTEQNEALQTMVQQQSNRVADVEAENARLQAKIESLQAVAEESEDYIAELEAELDKQDDEPKPSQLQAQLNRIEQQLLKQGHIPIESTSQTVGPPADENNPLRPSGGVGLKAMGQGQNSMGIGLKGLQVMTLPPPTFDDEDDDIPDLVVKKDTSTNATANFLASMKALQQGT
jgi:septal ring factor EnvC (AmiA/AmiB activator)